MEFEPKDKIKITNQIDQCLRDLLTDLELIGHNYSKLKNPKVEGVQSIINNAKNIPSGYEIKAETTISYTELITKQLKKSNTIKRFGTFSFDKNLTLKGIDF